MEKQLWAVLGVSFIIALVLNQRTSDFTVLDFSGLDAKTPLKVVILTSSNDIENVLKDSKRIAVQGAGHSMNGVSVTNSVQIINKNKEEMRWESDTLLTVSSGFTVQEVEYFARKNDRHVLCLQDKGIFSVGGSHAVGGIGWESIHCGTQNHHVEKIELILPNGTKVTASETKNREIFQFTLAGMGQTGYISSVTLRTVPYQKYHSIATYAFQTFKEAFEFLDNEKIEEKSLKQEIDLFHGGKHKMSNKLFFWLGKKFSSEQDAHNWQPPTSALPTRITVGKDWIGHNISLSNVSAYHLWTDYAFPSSAKALNFIDDIFGPKALEVPISSFHNSSSKIGFLALYLLKPQPNFIPLSVLGNTTNLSISIGFYHSFSSVDDSFAIKEQKRNQLGKAIDNQGRPYNYGYNPLTEQQANIVYGTNTILSFQSLRKLLDPLNIWSKSHYSALTMPL